MTKNDDVIENFDKIERIDGFISYEDYLALPRFRSYVVENDLALPDRIGGGKAAAEAAEKAESSVAAKKEKKTNVGAIITAVFGLLLAALAIAGCFVEVSPQLTRIFALYDENNFAELCKKLFGGEYVEIKAIIAAAASLVGVVFAAAFGVGALCRVHKRGVGTAVIVGTFVGFVGLAASAAIGMSLKVATPMGAAILLAAIEFSSAAISGSGKDGSKEKR